MQWQYFYLFTKNNEILKNLCFWIPVANDDVINSIIFIQLTSINFAMADRGKEGDREVQDFYHVKNERSFFGKTRTRSVFHNFLSPFFGEI